MDESPQEQPKRLGKELESEEILVDSQSVSKQIPPALELLRGLIDDPMKYATVLETVGGLSQGERKSIYQTVEAIQRGEGIFYGVVGFDLDSDTETSPGDTHVASLSPEELAEMARNLPDSEAIGMNSPFIPIDETFRRSFESYRTGGSRPKDFRKIIEKTLDSSRFDDFEKSWRVLTESEGGNLVEALQKAGASHAELRTLGDIAIEKKEFCLAFEAYEAAAANRETFRRLGQTAIEAGNSLIAFYCFAEALGIEKIETERGKKYLIGDNDKLIHREMGNCLKETLIQRGRQNAGEGLKLLVTASLDPAYKGLFHLGFSDRGPVSQENFGSEAVNNLEFSSDLLGMNIAVKIARKTQDSGRLMGIEQSLYREFGRVFEGSADLEVPASITSGDVFAGGGEYTLGVTEYRKNTNLADMLRDPDVLKGVGREGLIRRAAKATRVMHEKLGGFLDEQTKHYLRELDRRGRKSRQEGAMEYFSLDLGQEGTLRPVYQFMEKSPALFVWTKDIKPANWGYSPETGKLVVFDFNYLLETSPQWDWAKFIHDGALGRSERERALGIFLEEYGGGEQERELYYHCALLKNLYSTVFFWERGSKGLRGGYDLARQRLESAQEAFEHFRRDGEYSPLARELDRLHSAILK